MKEAHLRDFMAVVEQGGVRAAARKQGLTQAAVSRNLLALEQDCGSALLIRSNHGIELTESGRILLRRARAADTELKKAREEMEALSGRTRGGVSIGLSPAVEALLMSQAIDRFRERFPETLVRVTGGPAAITASGLREGRLDFIIGSANKNTGLAAERLLSVDLAIVGRKGHPMSGSTSLADLISCEWIIGVPVNADKAQLAEIFASEGLAAPTIAVQRDSSGVIHLLAKTDRLALVTRPSVQLYCDCGLLEFIPVRKKLPTIVMSVVTVEGRPLTLPAQHLANEFRRLARAWRR
jgi:DNA-binding transcriptional LysR family regulator